MLTKLYDFNLGSVTESSLWRSTDYGTTYEKLNEKVGVKTILSYLYVSPNNKRKRSSHYSSKPFPQSGRARFLLVNYSAVMKTECVPGARCGTHADCMLIKLPLQSVEVWQFT
ncbi:hypothetical protein AOLI_G00239010 [Acnodon oligacanthus]